MKVIFECRDCGEQFTEDHDSDPICECGGEVKVISGAMDDDEDSIGYSDDTRHPILEDDDNEQELEEGD